MLKKEYAETLGLLHDIYVHNLKAQGCIDDSYIATKEVFIQTQDADSVIDISRLLLIEDMNVFLYSSYLLLLHRTPDQGIVRLWKKMSKKNMDNNKKKLLISTLSSDEFHRKGQAICNNPWKSEVKVRRVLNYTLIPIYRLLPQSLKDVVKRILRRK